VRSDTEPPGDAAPPTLVRTVEASSTLDQMIFERNDWWDSPEEQQARFRLEALRSAVEHHLASCTLYAAYASRQRFDMRLLVGPETLHLVPQIPTLVFKRIDLASAPDQAFVRSFVSSGTAGTRSRVFRDEVTLERLAGSLRPDLTIWSDVVLERDLDEGGEVVHLGPGRAEAGDVWFSYVMGLIELFAPTTNCIREGLLDLDLAADRIRRCIAERRFVCVIGSPPMVLALCRHLQRVFGSVRAGDRALVVTGGGWKRTEATRIDQRSFVQLAMASLGLTRDAQVRDVFNQVELNTALIQCAQGRKHVPPWVEVIVRDPASLAPLPPGQPGLLSFLDASARSFPCFIIGEDLGWVWPDRCGCGRAGQAVAIDRRIEGATHQGCSLKLLESVRMTQRDLLAERGSP